MLLKRKKSQSGFILIATLIFLQSIFLLGWYDLWDSTLLLKTSHELYDRFHLFNAALFQLNEIEQTIQVKLPPCMIPISSFIQRENKLKNDEKVSVCHVKTAKFYFNYLIEILGENPCYFIQNKITIAQYVRVTLMAESHTHQRLIFLQSTVVKPIGTSQICQGQKHWVLQGHQFLRED